MPFKMTRYSILLSIFLVVATASTRSISPFFNKQQRGVEVGIDTQGNVVEEFKKRRELALRRQLNANERPNLPGGGIVGDEEAATGGGSGSMQIIGKSTKSGKKDSKKGTKLSKKDSKKSKSGKGSSKGDSGGKGSWDDEWEDGKPKEPCLCTPESCDCGGDSGGDMTTDYEFVMVRDEIGSDTPGEDDFGIASTIGLNGHVYEMIYTKQGRDFGGDPIGVFKGVCTVVSDLKGELLCTYEIYISSKGANGLGGVIATGPIAGLQTGHEFESIVTGAEFDFSAFNTGSLKTVQDPKKPILYSFLSLQV